MPLDQPAQVGDRQVRGVDDQVGVFAQRFGQGDVRRDAVRDHALRRQRMAAAGFGVAAQQGAFVGPGIHQLDAQAEAGAQPGDGVQHIDGVEAAGAGVDADGQLLVAAGRSSPPASSAAGCPPLRSRHPPAHAGSRPCRRRTGR